MSSTGLEVFDKTLQITNIWLKEIAEGTDIDRQAAWQMLGAVLRVLRDRLPVDDAAHLGAQLPLIVRGAFYDRYRPAIQPDVTRSREEFVARVAREFVGTETADPEEGIEAVFAVLDRHLGGKEAEKVRRLLPEEIRTLWPAEAESRGDRTMKVADVMTREVVMASPDEKIEDIARRMAAEDIGFLPVRDGDRLVGTITDRDIVVRALAKGMDGAARVSDVMTRDVKYCFADEDTGHVIQNMGDIQVRRLPVVDRDKRLVGVVTLADTALKDDPEAVGIALNGIVEPGGLHTSLPH